MSFLPSFPSAFCLSLSSWADGVEERPGVTEEGRMSDEGGWWVMVVSPLLLRDGSTSGRSGETRSKEGYLMVMVDRGEVPTSPDHETGCYPENPSPVARSAAPRFTV